MLVESKITCAYTLSTRMSLPNMVYQNRRQYSDAGGNSVEVIRAFLSEFAVEEEEW